MLYKLILQSEEGGEFFAESLIDLPCSLDAECCEGSEAEQDAARVKNGDRLNDALEKLVGKEDAGIIGDAAYYGGDNSHASYEGVLSCYPYRFTLTKN